MKELTLETMLAVFEDMFGFWLFWALVAVAAAITVLYLYVLHSHMRDIGGPIDVIIFLGIAVLGAVGIAILVYTIQSLLFPQDSADRSRKRAVSTPASGMLSTSEGS